MKVEIREKHGIKMWYYDFVLNKRRYRGWILPANIINRRQAMVEVEIIKANLINESSIFTDAKKCNNVKTVFLSYESYLKEHKESTWKNFQYIFSSSFTYFYPLRYIEPEDIQAYQRHRKSCGVSGATINRELEVARAAFNRAIKMKKWKGENPFLHFDHYPETSRTRFLSPEEIVELLKACRIKTDGHCPHLYEVVLVAIFTGMRKQEILTLQKSQINLTANVIITKATGTKKNSRDKYTPIPAELMQVLGEKIKLSKSGYLFENEKTGQPFGDMRKAFASAVKMAGIPDFKFHDLRHTFATYALYVSRDLKGVQELLGHSSIDMTSRYAHVLDERKIEIMARVSHHLSYMLSKK
jgi:integrase